MVGSRLQYEQVGSAPDDPLLGMRAGAQRDSCQQHKPGIYIHQVWFELVWPNSPAKKFQNDG
jgi:hypothetical protein